MKTVALPTNEQAQLDVLHRYQIAIDLEEFWG